MLGEDSDALVQWSSAQARLGTAGRRVGKIRGSRHLPLNLRVQEGEWQVFTAPHPGHQYQLAEPFQTDSSGHSICLHRRLAQTLSEPTAKDGLKIRKDGFVGPVDP